MATFCGIIAVPMLREGVPIGVITVLRPKPRPFSPSQIALLETFADQAVIAIENVNLFGELEQLAMTETLEQQTGEILRVISSSPTDVQPVFETIVKNARALCGSDSAAVFMYDGEMVQHRGAGRREPRRTGQRPAGRVPESGHRGLRNQPRS